MTYAQTVIEKVFPLNDSLDADIINEAQKAILSGVLPKRIKKGSSGSYYVLDTEGRKIAVFKPKDEEPYGNQNPKWIKTVQRMCCPCCFGRGCIIPNIGYLCETAASVIDQSLNLDIVPRTIILKIASQSFNYTKIAIAKSVTKKRIASKIPTVGHIFHRIQLPMKIGSFQRFVSNCESSMYWIKHFDNKPLPLALKNKFLFYMERLTILDYIIRNTDRTPGNWLIRYVPNQSSDQDDEDEVDLEALKVFAIDHGLAFPFKHPDQWRAYPYHWAWLPFVRRPFSQEIKDLVYDKLRSPQFVDILCHELDCVFSVDSQFDQAMFNKQMQVMRGQIENLVTALRENMSPAQLLGLPTLIIDYEYDEDERKCSKHVQVTSPLFKHW